MTDELVADFGAMSGVAAAQRQSRNALIRIQKARREVVLEPDALGAIRPARDLLKAFSEVNLATRGEIWDVARRCEDLSEGVREVRNLFRDVDTHISERFEALLGALIEVRT